MPTCLLKKKRLHWGWWPRSRKLQQLRGSAGQGPSGMEPREQAAKFWETLGQNWGLPCFCHILPRTPPCTLWRPETQILQVGGGAPTPHVSRADTRESCILNLERSDCGVPLSQASPLPTTPAHGCLGLCWVNKNQGASRSLKLRPQDWLGGQRKTQDKFIYPGRPRGAEASPGRAPSSLLQSHPPHGRPGQGSGQASQQQLDMLPTELGTQLAHLPCPPKHLED